MFNTLRKDYLYVEKNSNDIDVVIAAPHSINKKYPRIGDRLGDLYTGEISLDIFRRLNSKAKLVIKNRASADPNKNLNTDYFQEIIKEGKLLIEIHGAGTKSNFPIELSAGKNDLTRLGKFSLLLYEEMRKNKLYSFIFQEKKDYKRGIAFLPSMNVKVLDLRLPALETLSIDYVERLNMQAIHIELKENMRTTYRKDLVKVLSRTIDNFLDKNP